MRLNQDLDLIVLFHLSVHLRIITLLVQMDGKAFFKISVTHCTVLKMFDMLSIEINDLKGKNDKGNLSIHQEAGIGNKVHYVKGLDYSS